MSIKDRIKAAPTTEEIDSLLDELKTYRNVTPHTFNACVKRAKERSRELNKS